MNQSRKLLTGITAIGIFSLGYLTGRSANPDSTSDTSSSSSSHSSVHKTAPSPSDSPSTKPHPRSTNADATPNLEKGFSRRIVEMMSKGELNISGVGINYVTFTPAETVKDFLNLTDSQIETLKQIGRDRLQARQQHEQSIAKITKSTADQIVFDIPPDPAFAASQKEGFVESLRKEFGPDVAAILQGSIGAIYSEFEHPRHVRYTITPLDRPIPDDATPETRRILESGYNFSSTVNQNEDGTNMTDEHGRMLHGTGSNSGTLYLSDLFPDTSLPRYHYLWERQQKN